MAPQARVSTALNPAGSLVAMAKEASCELRLSFWLRERGRGEKVEVEVENEFRQSKGEKNIEIETSQLSPPLVLSRFLVQLSCIQSIVTSARRSPASLCVLPFCMGGPALAEALRCCGVKTKRPRASEATVAELKFGLRKRERYLVSN